MLELFNTAFACRKGVGGHDDAARGRAAARSLVSPRQRTGDDAASCCVSSHSIACMERYQKLEDAAQAYEDYAREVYAASLAMALERKHDGRARWVALTIGDKFRTLFGQADVWPDHHDHVGRPRPRDQVPHGPSVAED